MFGKFPTEAHTTLLAAALVSMPVFLGSCADQPGQFGAKDQVPGGTFADPRLQRDAAQMMFLINSAKDVNCKERSVVDTQILEQPTDVTRSNGKMITGYWVEKWTLDACGNRSDYQVTFRADGKGGTYFEVKPI